MNYHEPQELLTQEDMDMHRILQSIIEEIEAVDWYYQRAAATENPLVRKFVLHNAHEEIEHALIGIEYLRRISPVWSDMIDEYLYQDGELMAEYNEDGLKKEAALREKLAHQTHWGETEYLTDVETEEAGLKRELENDYINQGELDKFNKWKNTIKPRWDNFQKEVLSDPKVQKFESLIEQAEGERQRKLQQKLQEYIKENHKNPVRSDGKYQGLKKKLERAKRKEYPNDKWLPEGKSQHSSEYISNTGIGGAGLGTLAGLGIGGYVGSSKGKSTPGKILKGLAGAGTGALYGSVGGLATGVVGGLATSPIARKFVKDKAKYNKKGVVNKRENNLYDRERYLRQGHNLDY